MSSAYCILIITMRYINTIIIIITCERRGMMVTPAWPPMTGTDVADTSRPLASATNVLARTISSVVTPKSLSGLYAPAFL